MLTFILSVYSSQNKSMGNQVPYAGRQQHHFPKVPILGIRYWLELKEISHNNKLNPPKRCIVIPHASAKLLDVFKKFSGEHAYLIDNNCVCSKNSLFNIMEAVIIGYFCSQVKRPSSNPKRWCTVVPYGSLTEAKPVDAAVFTLLPALVKIP